MTLSSANGTQLSTFRIEKYHQMYHLPQWVNRMVALLYTPKSNVNTRDIMKHWVKEPSKFGSTPNRVYKTKSSERPANSWSSLHVACTIKRARRIFRRIGWLCWNNWKIKEGHSTGWICCLLSWKCMWVMPGIHPMMSKQDSICLCTYLMQYVPNISFLAWVGHGHH